MFAYLAKRVLLIVPMLFLITVFSYALMRVAPGDPVRATMMGGQGMGEGAVGERKAGDSDAAKAFRKYFHLDEPWYVGYWYWLAGDDRPEWVPVEGEVSSLPPGTETRTGANGLPERRNPSKQRGVIRGDFGISITVSLGKPVLEIINERLRATLKLNFWAILVVYLIAIPSGIFSAVARDGWLSLTDKCMTTIFFLLYSLPSFWVGLLLILLVGWCLPGWPISGLSSELPAHAPYFDHLWDAAKHYVLPVFCLSYAGFASLSRFSRSSILEVIGQDYIRTARAKGLGEWTVILKHALRNGAIPLITLFAGMLPGLIGGSIIIEYLFDINGMGNLMQTALSSRDYPLLMIDFTFGSLLTLLGILLSDILYVLVDPRITFD